MQISFLRLLQQYKVAEHKHLEGADLHSFGDCVRFSRILPLWLWAEAFLTFCQRVAVVINTIFPV